MKHPLISIIVVNYNGKKWLPACLSSLKYQTYPKYEVILVDNHSSDGSVKYVKANFPKVKIVINSSNLGFATGNNIGASIALGDYLVLLNNDTRVPPDYLTNFHEAFAAIPNLAIAQSQIILMAKSRVIDSCGSFWTLSTNQYYFGNGKSSLLSIYQTSRPVFSVKGASVMIKKDVINKTGLFDDDFWCYYEETDFCHRAWIAGYECWYWPNTYVHHALGSTSLTFPNSLIQYHNFKNKLNSLLKNLEIKTLIYELPIFLILNLLVSIFWLFQRKPKHFLAMCQSLLWNIKEFPHTLSKRILIQAHRVRTDGEIFKIVKKEPRISYFYYLFKNRLDLYDD